MVKKLFSILFLVATYIGINAQTSLGNQRDEDKIVVAYPNPAKDFLFLKAKDASLKIKSATFYSILGVQVAEYPINTNSIELRLDRLKPGKYLLRYILSDNSQKTIQIVKQ